MQTQKIILETNFTERYENEPRLKLQLVDELHDGNHFSYISKYRRDDGVEGGTQTYFDFEKALKKFIKRVAEERKQGCNHKKLKILAPSFTNDVSSHIPTIESDSKIFINSMLKTGIETNSKQFIGGLIGLKERVDRLEQQLTESNLISKSNLLIPVKDVEEFANSPNTNLNV